MKKLIIILSWLTFPFSVNALYLGPPTVYETPAEQAANLSTSKRKLSRLQKAAEDCSDMRLLLVHSGLAYLPEPMELPLNDYEKKQLRYLIKRMKAVKETGAASQDYIERLQLLNSNGQPLASVDFHDVVSNAMVSGQGYAQGARLVLSEDDAAIWLSCMKPAQARALATNPTPSGHPSLPQRKPHKIKEPEPEPPPVIENETWHENCDHKHNKHDKRHKHKSKNHFCTHH
ncbi:MAG: hypothetical protein IKZ13_02425 [Akkermansia sp.]|nr:hypothetical protein [Akkermansia sp.]